MTHPTQGEIRPNSATSAADPYGKLADSRHLIRQAQGIAGVIANTCCANDDLRAALMGVQSLLERAIQLSSEVGDVLFSPMVSQRNLEGRETMGETITETLPATPPAAQSTEPAFFKKAPRGSQRLVRKRVSSCLWRPLVR